MRISLRLCLVLSVLAAPSFAQTSYDPSDYFMLKPGLWRIDESRLPGQPSNGQFATVVTQLGNFRLQNEFEMRGANWIPQDVQVFELKPNELLYHGSQNPITNDYELITPPLRFPRTMRVGDVVQQRVTVTTPQGSTVAAFTALLSADGITKTVKSGTFNNCLRMEISFLSDGVIETEVRIMAKTQGLIWGFSGEIDVFNSEPNMGFQEIYERARP